MIRTVQLSPEQNAATLVLLKGIIEFEMDKYDIYSERLSDYMGFSIAVLVFMAVAIVALLIACLKTRSHKMAVITVVGGLVITLGLYFTGIFPYQIDISEKAYVTYSGEFYVEDCYSVNGGGTYILIQYGDHDESVRYKVLCDIDAVESDTAYAGTFVYSKHSQCLCDIELQADSQ